MEEWESEHIEKNLSQLIKLTSCTVILKTTLRERNFITDEEEDRLSTSGRLYGRHHEAKELYEILKTRTGGYKALIDVLQDTKQTGALHILKCKSRESLDKPDFAQRLLDVSVRISNKEKPLREVFPDLTAVEAMEILKNENMYCEFLKILEDESALLSLDGEIPVPHKLYIPRSISNRLLLDPKIFKMDCPDVFVFQEMERRDLVELVRPRVTRSSNSQLNKITCRYIFLDEKEDWDDMVMVCKAPIHLITKEAGDYILQRSKQVTDIIHENCMNKSKPQHAYISEDQFAEKLLEKHNAKGAVLCDVPGMGKTWLMQNIAWKMRNKSETSIVIFISLAAFSKTLCEEINQVKTRNTLKYVLQYTYRSKLAMKLVTEHVKKHKNDFFIVLDGFDEIRDIHTNAATSFFQNLNRLNNVHLIVSSRPHMRTHLEKKFELVSSDILPFGRDDQVKAIVGHWLNSVPNATEAGLNEFANTCVDAIKKFDKAERSDILGVPLKCYLLAVVNEIHCQQLCKPNRRTDKPINETATIESIPHLYQKFVDNSEAKLAETHPEILSEDLRTRISLFHTYQALKLLFPELADVFFKNFKMESSVPAAVDKMGIWSVKTASSDSEFIHRSFAEYFSGKFLAEFWMSVDEHDPLYMQTVSSYFIKHVLRTSNPSLYLMVRDVKIATTCMDFVNYMSKSKITFHYSSVLWFMNSVYETSMDPLRACDKVVLNYDKKWATKFFRKNTYIILLATIGEGYSAILPLLFKLLKVFLSDMKISSTKTHSNIILPDLLLHPSICTKEMFKYRENCVAFLLCWIAWKGTPESAQYLFNTFENKDQNLMLRFCQHYPAEFWSPLEMAILRKDIDVAFFFADKVSFASERLLVMMFRKDGVVTQEDIDSRIVLIEQILGGTAAVLQALSSKDLEPHLDQAKVISETLNFDIPVLVGYARKTKFRWENATVRNKSILISICLCENNDRELIKLLFDMFGNRDCDQDNVWNLQFEDKSGSGITNEFKAEDVLKLLNLKAAREIFSEIRMHNARHCLQFIDSVETLKVLTTIVPDASKLNYLGWNYLHFASRHGKSDILRHLIKEGYDVNETDACGNTPMLCQWMKKPVEVTDYLINSGADVYALNELKENVAHRSFEGFVAEDEIDVLIRWVNYINHNGHGRLLTVRDYKGRTPFAIIAEKIGWNHPVLALGAFVRVSSDDTGRARSKWLCCWY